MEDYSPLTADAFLPSQFADLFRSQGPNAGIKKLMLAILEISLRDALGARSAGKAHRKFRLSARARARADAERSRRAREHAVSAIDWIFDDDAIGAFSFRNVCETLGIDGKGLRVRIRGRRAA